MISKYVLPALAAAVGLVSAQCEQDEFTINAQADITKLGTCRTLKGKVVIGTRTDSILNLGQGIQSIDGDLELLNNGGVTSLSGSGLNSISGQFHLQNLTALSSLNFPALTSVGSVNFQSLTALDALTFTSGIRTAREVTVADTFLSSLEGLNMVSVAKMDINNNRRLVRYESRLGNLTDNLNINANGLNLQVSFPNLIWIANATISNVSSFDAPALRVVNGSLRFDSNFFRTFTCPNLTSTTSGDISFVSNPQVTNISLPALTSVGGGFLIANNTALQKIDGFPKLKTVGGAIKLRGNFTDIQFPALEDVKGAFDAVSTNDINTPCTKFQDKKNSGQIQGDFNCASNNANANSDTGSGGSGGGNGNAAPGLSVNTGAVLGLALVGVFFQALM